MGFLDLMEINLFRKGVEGGRYFAPLGNLGPIYRVPDDASARGIRRRHRILVLVASALFAAALILQFAVEFPLLVGWLFLVLALEGLHVILAAFELPQARIAWEVFEPLNWTETLKTAARAAGETFLFRCLVVSTALVAFSVPLALLRPGLATVQLAVVSVTVGLLTLLMYFSLRVTT